MWKIASGSHCNGKCHDTGNIKYVREQNIQPCADNNVAVSDGLGQQRCGHEVRLLCVTESLTQVQQTALKIT